MLASITKWLSESSCTTADDYTPHRAAIAAVCNIVDSKLAGNAPSIEDFGKYLESSHNLFITCDAIVRATLLRVVRVILMSVTELTDVRRYVSCIEQYKWHWLVSLSLEREPIVDNDEDNDYRRGNGSEGGIVRQDFVFERMQALKVVKIVIARSPSYIPIVFARSVVAVSNNKKDNIRKVCVEMLREMCVVNTPVVIVSNGLDALLTAAFDPAFKDMITSITTSILFMLNTEKSRRLLRLRSQVDLRAFIAPFTDIDASEEELLPRWEVSKCALVVILKSWVGITMMSADKLGLPTLVRMLRDARVPAKARGIILDALVEVFEPIFSRMKRSRLLQRNDKHYSRTLSVTTATSIDDLDSNSYMSVMEESSQAHKDDMGFPVPNDDDANQTGAASNKSNTVKAAFGMLVSSASSTIIDSSKASVQLAAMNAQSSQYTKQGNGADTGGVPITASNGETNAPAPAPAPAPAATKRKSSFFGNMFGGSKDAKPPVPPASAGGGIKGREARSVSMTLPESPGSGNGSSGGDAGDSSPSASSYQSTSGRSRKKSMSALCRTTTYVDSVIYNAFDNYTALLCSALIHCELIESLSHMGTHGESELAAKARWLLVEFMRTVGNILPEGRCSELLELPALIEFSSSTLARPGMTSRAFKSSQLLEMIANAFTVAPRDFQFSHTAESFLYTRPPKSSSSSASYTDRDSIGESSEKRSSNSNSSSNRGRGQDSLLTLPAGFSAEQMDINNNNNFYGQFMDVGILGQGSIDGLVDLCSVAEFMAPFYTKDEKGAEADAKLLDIFNSNSYNSSRSRSSSVGIASSKTASADVASIDGSYIEMDSKKSTISIQGGQGSIAANNSAAYTQMKSIQSLRLSHSLKRDHMKTMEETKVNGALGKEPFRWNWKAIHELLKYAFLDGATGRKPIHSGFGNNSNHALSINDNLADVMKTKFVRRLSGFYRCSTAEKGYFANCTWEPANFSYYDCACTLYEKLVADENGHDFLNSDRRGMLFTEIGNELHTLLSVFDKSKLSSSSFFSPKRSNDTGQSIRQNTLAFRMNALQRTLSREYFPLVGRVLRHEGGRAIVDSSDIFENLSEIGKHPQLDYLSRVVISNMIFTDKGTMSRHLIRIWTSGVDGESPSQFPRRYSNVKVGGLGSGLSTSLGSSDSLGSTEAGTSGSSRKRTASVNSRQPVVGRGRGMCSLGLKNYIYNLLGAFLQARSLEFQDWGIDVVVNMMLWETPGDISRHLVRLLIQIVQRMEHLVLFVEKLEELNEINGRQVLDLTVDKAYLPVIHYFLTIPQGIAYCSKGRGSPIKDGSYLEQLLQDYSTAESSEGLESYVQSYEKLLAKSLSPAYVKNVLSPSEHIRPIPYLSRDFSSTYSNGPLLPQNNINSSDLISDYTSASTDSAKLFNAGASRDSTAGSNSWRHELPDDSKSTRDGKNRYGIPYAFGTGNYSNGGTSSGTSSTSASNQNSFKHAQNINLASDVRESEGLDLEGLLKLPWNLEVKSFKPLDTRSEDILPGTPGGEYITVDCYLDTSDLVIPAVNDICTDANRFMKVRALVLDEQGLPGGRAIKDGCAVASTLMVGVCPVNKTGGMKTCTRVSTSAGISITTSFEQAKRYLQATQNQNKLPPEMNGVSDKESPPTYQLEELYDWTLCRPYSGLYGTGKVTAIDDNFFSMEIPGEPCKFIFSKTKPITSFAADAVGGGVVSNKATSRGSLSSLLGMSGIGRSSLTAPSIYASRESENENMTFGSSDIYLVEIQYYLAVYIGHSHFVRLPTHPYSMLSRTQHGTTLLQRRGIIRDLIAVITTTSTGTTNNSGNNITSCSSRRLKAALWALGHIASSDAGFGAIVSESRKIHEAQAHRDMPPAPPAEHDMPPTHPIASARGEEKAPNVPIQEPEPETETETAQVEVFSLVEWCIEQAGSHTNYSVRGTIFAILGLISRSERGKTILSKFDWDASSHGCNSAVAVPRNSFVLFSNNISEEDKNCNNDEAVREELLQQTFPQLRQQNENGNDQNSGDGTVREGEAMNLISKLNGSPGTDTRTRLERLKRESPEVFSSRRFFCAIMQLFELHHFSLDDRRFVIHFFAPEAMLI